MQTTQHPDLTTGATVYGSDGEKIGDISDVQPGYFTVKEGVILTTELHFPTSLVSGADDDGVRLSISKADVEAGDWSSRPVLSDQEAPGPVGYAGQHTDASAAGGLPHGVNGENGYDSHGELERDRR
jgi:hypothetical protein